MDNLSIKLPLVNGGELPFDFANGKELIDAFCSDDINPPPTCMLIEARTKDNNLISICIPYDSKAVTAHIKASLLDAGSK